MLQESKHSSTDKCKMDIIGGDLAITYGNINSLFVLLFQKKETIPPLSSLSVREPFCFNNIVVDS